MYSSSNELDSILESMFNDHESSDSADLTLMAALESIDSVIADTVGVEYTYYASEGVGASIVEGIKKIITAIKNFFKRLGEKIKAFWAGLTNKHKASQEKVETAVMSVKEHLRKSSAEVKGVSNAAEERAAAIDEIAEFEEKFNSTAVEAFVSKVTEATNEIKSSISKLNDQLVRFRKNNWEAQNAKVQDAKYYTNIIEKSIKAVQKAEDDLANKKSQAEEKLKKVLDKKYTAIARKDLDAMTTLCSSKMGRIEYLHKVLTDIYDIIEDNETLAERLESDLTEPDENATKKEKTMYDNLKKAVDVWKEVSTGFKDYVEAAVTACDKARGGFTKVSQYVPTDIVKNDGVNTIKY